MSKSTGESMKPSGSNLIEAETLPSFDDILRAEKRLEGHIIQTPLLVSERLDEITGGHILLKPEVLQKTGSFKFRGAYNFISQLDRQTRQRGVLAYSSGNHAQAVAYAAQLFDIPATIVMPSDAPRIKIEKTQSYGASVVLYDRQAESREAIAQALAEESGATLLPPYDHPYTIAGQGTVGMEIYREANARHIKLDKLLAPCSGGGLIAGCALAIKAMSPETEIYSVEPEGFDDTARSLQAKQRQRNAPGATTMCDALMMPEPGRLTFQINAHHLHGGLAVTDDEVKAAMRFAFEHLKLVVEPGGAVALAAVLSGKIKASGQIVAVVLSGGNVDVQRFAEILAG